MTFAGAPALLTVHGKAENDRFDLPSAFEGQIQLFDATHGTFRAVGINVSAGSSVNLVGHDGDDQFNIIASVPFPLTVNGGNPDSGSDVLFLTGAAGSAETVTIQPNAANLTQQSITGFGGALTATGVELITYVGTATAGIPDDTLVLVPGFSGRSMRLDDIALNRDRVISDTLPEIQFTGLNLFRASNLAADFEITFVMQGLAGTFFGTRRYEVATAAGFPGTTLVIEGDGSANNYAVTNPAGTPSVDIRSDFFDQVVRAVDAGVSVLKFNALGGDDTVRVNVNAATGSDIVAVPIEYDGGGGSDALHVTGTPSAAIDHVFYTPGPAATEGRLRHSGANLGSMTIDFANLEPVRDFTTATNLTVNGTEGDNAINYRQGDAAGQGRVTVDEFEFIEFGNKTNLFLNGLAGSDTININNSNTPAGLTSITVSGGDPPGSDTLIVSGTADANLTAAGVQADVIDFRPANADSGEVRINDGFAAPALDLPNVVFSLIEHVTINGQGGDDLQTVTTPAGEHLIALDQGALADEGSMVLRGAISNGGGALVPLSFTNLGADGALVFADVSGTRVDHLTLHGTDATDEFTVFSNGVIESTRTSNAGLLVKAMVNVGPSGVRGLDVVGFGGDDAFSILGSHPFSEGLFIDGGDPSASDTLNYSASSGNVSLQVASAIVTQVGIGPVNWRGLERVNVSTSTLPLTVSGGDGDSVFDITPAPTGGVTFTASEAPNTTFSAVAGGTLTFSDQGGGSNAINLHGDDSFNFVTVNGSAVTADGVPFTIAPIFNVLNILTAGGLDFVTLQGSIFPAVVVDSGSGDDSVFGSAATTGFTALGGAGVDTLTGGSGSDVLDGGDGDDTLVGNAGNDRLFGGAGLDQLRGNAGADNLEGGDDGDVIYSEGGGDDETDFVDGGSGNDLFNFDNGDGDYVVEAFLGTELQVHHTLGATQTFSSSRSVEEVSVGFTNTDGDFLVRDLTGTGVQQVNLAVTRDFNFVLGNLAPGAVTVEGTLAGDTITAARAPLFSAFQPQPNELPVVAMPWGRVHFNPGGADSLLVINGKEGDDTIKVDADFPLSQPGTPLIETAITLVGGAGHDTLLGGPGDETFDGGDGDDSYVGNGGTSIVVAGSGTDTIVVHGTPGADTLVLSRSGSDLIANINGEVTTYESFTNAERILVEGGDGNDSLTIDETGGLIPLPITFEGAGGDDSLALSGGTDIAATYNVGPGVDAGNIVHTAGQVTQTVFFTGLEPVIDTSGGTLTVNGTNADNAINYRQGSVAANGLVSVDNQETIEFSNKTSLTIDGLAGSDTINLNNPNTPAGPLGGITVRGGDPTADSDTLIANGLSGVNDNFFVNPTGAGSGTITKIGGPQPPITFSGMEHLNVVGQASDADTFQYTGTVNTDTFEYTPGSTPDSGTVTGFSATGTVFPFVPATFAGMNRHVFVGSGGGQGAAGGLDTVVVNGSDANDIFSLFSPSGFASDAVRLITGSTGHAPVLFNADRGTLILVLRGLSGNDRFDLDFNPIPISPTVNFVIEGDGGTDTLNHAANANAATSMDLLNSRISSTGTNPVTFSGVEQINHASSGAAATLNVTSNGSDDVFSVWPGIGGNGRFTASLQPGVQFAFTGVGGAFQVASTGSGTDQLIVNGTEDPEVVNVSGSAVEVVGRKTVNYVNFDDLRVNGLAGDDTFNVTPSSTTTMFIDGGDPIGVLPGDHISMAGPATINAGPESDEGSLATAGNQPVNFDHIESITITGPGPGGPAIVNGTNGPDAITIIARDASTHAGADGDQDFTVSVNGGIEVLYLNTPAVAVNALSGDDEITVRTPAPNDAVWNVQVTIDGGASTSGDNVILETPFSGAETATYTPSGLNSGQLNLTDNTSLITMLDIEDALYNGMQDGDSLTVTTPNAIITQGSFAGSGLIEPFDALSNPLLKLSYLNVTGLVSISGTAAVVQGTAGDDIISVSVAGVVTVSNSNNIVQNTFDASGFTDLLINALGGNDTVNIPGNHPFENITLLGGEPSAGSDVLNFTGSGSGAVTVDLDGATVQEAGFGAVSFTSVELLNANAAGQNLTLNATNGDDTLAVTTSSRNAATAVLASSAASVGARPVVNGSNIGTFTVDMLGGVDRLEVNATEESDTINVDGDSVERVGDEIINYASVNQLTVFGHGGSDTFNVTASGVQTFIDGGDPIGFAGDRLQLTVPAGAGTTTFQAGPEGDEGGFSFAGAGIQPVSYDHIETVAPVDLSAAGGALNIVATNADNDINIVGIDGDSLTVSIDGGPAIQFDGVTALNVDALAGDDDIDLTVGPLAIGNISIIGNDPTASDILLINGTGGPDTVTFTATSADSGSLLGLATTVTFTTTEHVVFNGQGGNDAVTINTPATDTDITVTAGSTADSGDVQVDSLVPLRFTNIGLTGTLHINDAGGIDQLDYLGTEVGDNFFVLATTGTINLVSGLFFGQIDHIDVSQTGIEDLGLDGLADADFFEVDAPQSYANIYLAGGDAGGSQGDASLVVGNGTDAMTVSLVREVTLVFGGGITGLITQFGIENVVVNAATADVTVNGSGFDDEIVYTALDAESALVHVVGTDPLVRLDAIGDLTITGGGGSDALTVNANQAANTITVDGTSVLVDALQPVNAYSDFGFLTVNGLAGDDTFNVTSSTTTAIFVDGGDPIGVFAPGGGDTIFVALADQFFPGPEVDEGGFLSGSNQPVSFDHIENIGPIVGSACVIVFGTTGDDDITIIARDESYIQPPGTPIPPGLDGIQDFTVSVNGGPDVLYIDVPVLYVDALAGDDDIVLRTPAPNGAAWNVDVFISGGPPAAATGDQGDVFELETPGTNTVIYTPTGLDTGTLLLDQGAAGASIEDSLITIAPFLNACPSSPTAQDGYNSSPGGVEQIVYQGLVSSDTPSRVISAAVSNPGSGYSVGDVLTVLGGTFTTPATLMVTSAPGGLIGSVSVLTPGVYSVPPANPVIVTGGTGTGATFNLTLGLIGDTLTINGTSQDDHFTVNLNNGGSGSHRSNVAPAFDYSGANLVTVSGGSGGFDDVEILGTDASDVVTSTATTVSMGGGTVTFAGGIEELQVLTLGGGDSVSLGTTIIAQVDGGAGNDLIIGVGTARRTLLGGAGDDALFGGGGADRLEGGEGDDVLVGGGGDDFAYGGAGSDTFVWNPGEADDLFEGDEGEDTLAFAGANGTDNYFISGDNGRVLFQRVQGNVGINLGGVENIFANSETIELSGRKEVQPNATTSGGFANFTYNAATGLFDIRIFVTGLAAANILDSHIHMSIAGANGPVVVPFGGGAGYVAVGGGLERTATGLSLADIIPPAGFTAQQVLMEILLGRAYFNVHSPAFPGGEIRGNIIVSGPTAGSGGADTLTVRDTTGTSLRSIVFDAGNEAEIRNGAALVDTVTVEGLNTADHLLAAVTNAQDNNYLVTGLPYNILVTNSDGTASTVTLRDQLIINGNGGDDNLKALPPVESVTRVTLNGNDGNDFLSTDAILNGGDGNDTLEGGSGDDTIDGGPGNDIILFHEFNAGGTDTLTGGTGADTILVLGGVGNDDIDVTATTISVNGALTTIAAASATIERIQIDSFEGNDDIAITGTPPGVNVTPPLTVATVFEVNAGDDNDTVNASGQSTAVTIYGGFGNDTLTGGGGIDTIYGEAGNDTISGRLGADQLKGGDDFDIFTWNDGDGADIVDGGGDGADIANINGAALVDTFTVTAAGNQTHLNVTVVNSVNNSGIIDYHGVENFNLNPGGGADDVTLNDLTPTEVVQVNVTVDAALSADADLVTVNGRDAADVLMVSTSPPPANRVDILGLEYSVQLRNVEPNDTLTVNGNDGDDSIKAVPGVEATVTIVFNGGQGDDFLSADATLNGDAGNDLLIGGTGADTINGGPGDDVIDGRGGTNTITGGPGGAGDTDTFLVTGTAGPDTITTTHTTGTFVIAAGIPSSGTNNYTSMEAVRVEAGEGADSVALELLAEGGLDYEVLGGNPIGSFSDQLDIRTPSHINFTPGPEGDSGQFFVNTTDDTRVSFDELERAEVIGTVAGLTATHLGTSGDDDITVKATSATAIEVTANGAPPVGYSNFDSFSVLALDGDDDITVSPISPAIPGAVLAFPVSVSGGSPAAATGDQLTVEGSSAGETIAVNLAAGTITVGTAAAITFTNTTELLAISALGGTDTMTITGSALYEYTPAVAHDAGTIQTTNLPIAFTGLSGGETITLTGDNQADLLIANGTNTNDLITVAAATGNVVVNGHVILSPSGIETLTLNGYDGDDTFTVGGPLPYTTTNIAAGDPSASDVANITGDGTAVTVTLAITPASTTDATVTGGGLGTVNLSSVERANVANGAGAITITGRATGESIEVTPTGANTARIEPSELNLAVNTDNTGTLTIDAADGSDVLTVNGTESGETITVDADSVAVGALKVVNYSDTEALRVFGHAGNDAFNVTAAADTTIFVDGGDPIGVSPGDSITVNGAIGFAPGPENDEGGFLTLGQTVSFDHIESAVVNSNGPCPFLIIGTGADDDITVIARDSVSTPQFAGTDGVQDFTVTVNSGLDVLFINEPDLYIDALAGDDDIVIRAPAPNDADWNVHVRVVGGPPSMGEPNEADRLVLETPGEDSLLFTPSGPDTGTLLIDEGGVAGVFDGTDTLITIAATFVFECDDPPGGPIEFTYTSSPGGVELIEYDGELTGAAATDDVTIAGTSVADLYTITPVGVGPGGNGQGTYVSPASPLFHFRGFDDSTVNGGAGGFDMLIYNARSDDDTITSDADTITLVGTDVNLGTGMDRLEMYTFSGIDNIDLNLTAATLFIKVDSGDGGDTVDLAGSVAANVFAGNGNDAVIGSPGVDSIFGGTGNDVLIGGGNADFIYGEEGNDRFGDPAVPAAAANDAGDDNFFGGDGSDTFVWDPGDGNDTIEGGADESDVLIFNGAAAAETFTFNADGTRLELLRSVGPIDMNVAGVEQVNLSMNDGNDAAIVNDLYPTDVRVINISVGATGDDTVTVHGRNVADTVNLGVAASIAAITGLRYDVNVSGAAAVSGAGGDVLNFLGNDGDDIVVASDGLNALFAVEDVVTSGGNGDDRLSGFGTLNGDAGNDTLVGGALVNLINGGDGNDQIAGGSGGDTLNGGAGEDLFIPGFDSAGDTIDGGADFDTILVQATSANDRIDARQDSPTSVSYEVSGIGGDGVIGGAGTEIDTLVSGTVEELRIVAGAGDDIIRVTHADSLIVDDDEALSLRFTVEGGSPGASDRLTVTDDGLGDTTIHRIGGAAGSGSFTIGALAPVVYSDVEFASLNPVDPITGGAGTTDTAGRLWVFKYDPYESNNSRPNATFLGSGATINVDPTIDPGADVPFSLPGDEDWYRLVAHHTGDLDIRVSFRQQGDLSNGRDGLPGSGDLDIALYDADGQPAAIAGAGAFGNNDINDDERIRIPVVEGQTYYLRVKGAALANTSSEAVNVYNLSIVNTPAPVPFDLELDDEIAEGTVVTGSSTTSFTGSASLSAVDDFYNGKVVSFKFDTTTVGLRGEEAVVLDYDGTSRTFTLAFPLSVTPAANDAFQIESVDTGRNSTDNITRDNTPTIFLRVADAALLNDIPDNAANPGGPPDETIVIPFVAGTDLDALSAGFRVAVFRSENNTHTPVGYAQQVAGSPGLYSFTFSSSIPDGSHFISARLEMIDPAQPQQAQGFGAFSQSLEIIVDTANPPISFGDPGVVGDGLTADSDTFVAPNPETVFDSVTRDVTPTFWGRAEADATVRLYADSYRDLNNDGDFDFVDVNANGTFDLGIDTPIDQLPNGVFDPNFDVFIGQDTAIPLDGNQQEPNGFWKIESVINFLDPRFFVGIGGARTIFGTAEDVAGNVNDEAPEELEIFIDVIGPQVTAVTINAVNDTYDLFDPKPSTDGPTPLVNSLVISFQDLPPRTAAFLIEALKEDVADSPGLYVVRGDYNGIIPILEIIVTNLPPVVGQPAFATVELVFRQAGADGVFNTADDIGAPLPDDRFTLTVSDSIIDLAGNNLDGESNASEPHEVPTFPSGDGIPGGDFVARFTVDTRPEVGVWAAGSAWLDINGNTSFDPNNLDYTNRDFTNVLGLASDDLFAGKFMTANNPADRNVLFDKLGAYGRVGTTKFRWLIDTDSDGVPNVEHFDPANINGLPVSGNFGPFAGDEVGVFTGTRWHFDTDHNWQVDVSLAWPKQGYPIVGDFDGDGLDDLATWTDDKFSFDLSTIDSSAGGVLPGNPGIDGTIERSFKFGFIGPTEQPVAADMNMDGIDDVGLWVPARDGVSPGEAAEWYFLMSGVVANDTAGGAAMHGPSITGGSYPVASDGPGAHREPNLYGLSSYDYGRIVIDPLTPSNQIVRFNPTPFGKDIYFQFGDQFALPLVGNFDPPVTQTPGGTPRDPLDTNNDSNITAIDALLVFNHLNRQSAVGETAAASGPSYLDVNGDMHVTAIDALRIINYLNAHPVASGEGEGVMPASAAEDEASGMDALLDLLAEDVERARRRRR
jgi:Ca2+-binding RTX toxin-like protein